MLDLFFKTIIIALSKHSKKCMCKQNITEGALNTFHMLVIRVHMGPRITKLTCLHLLLANFMTICI